MSRVRLPETPAAAHRVCMRALQDRIARGIPAGGQFTATVHAEPGFALAKPEIPETTDPQVLRNLNRSVRPIPELTSEQKAGLRRRKTPLLDAFKLRGTTVFAPKAKVLPREETPAV